MRFLHLQGSVAAILDQILPTYFTNSSSQSTLDAGIGQFGDALFSQPDVIAGPDVG